MTANFFRLVVKNSARYIRPKLQDKVARLASLSSYSYISLCFSFATFVCFPLVLYAFLYIL